MLLSLIILYLLQYFHDHDDVIVISENIVHIVDPLLLSLLLFLSYPITPVNYCYRICQRLKKNSKARTNPSILRLNQMGNF